MNFDRDRPTPSRLSAEAAVALPRLALLMLLAAFALPGVFGRDLVSMAIVAVALYGLSVASERPVVGAALTGLCAAALALSRGPLLAAGLLAGCILGLALCTSCRRRWLAMSVCTACALGLAPAVALWKLP